MLTTEARFAWEAKDVSLKAQIRAIDEVGDPWVSAKRPAEGSDRVEPAPRSPSTRPSERTGEPLALQPVLAQVHCGIPVSTGSLSWEDSSSRSRWYSSAPMSPLAKR